jgi:hypothetical protein
LDGEAQLFAKLISLGSGESVAIHGGLEGVVSLGQMADRYQVDVVQEAVEDAVLSLLTTENCGLVLDGSWGSGWERVERASRALALVEFDEFAATAGIIEVGEEVLVSLRDGNGLMTESEERVFEATVRWMRGGDGGWLLGEGLLRKVRFPFMDRRYLAALSTDQRPKGVGLEGLVRELLMVGMCAWGIWMAV